jgi:hypothetical protein
MQLHLTKGYVAEIDDIDRDLAETGWYASIDTLTVLNDKIYASCNKGSLTRLHRVILARMLNRPLSRGEECDHIDGNSLNNKRNNLRLVTHQQNIRNKRKNVDTRFKGVYHEKFTGKYKAQIVIDGKNYNLGRYVSEEDAARVYDAAAIKYFGEYAKTNGLDIKNVVLPSLVRPIVPMSGVKGVHKQYNKWQAVICHNGKQTSLGCFPTIDEARVAYEKRWNELHRK